MGTSAMKNTIADSAEQARQFDALRELSGAYADARLKVAELSGKYPEAAKWLERMAAAAQVAAVSLAALGLANLIGKGLPAVAASGSGAAITAGLGAGAASIGRLAAGGLGFMAGNFQVLSLLGAGAAGYGVGSIISNAIEGTKASDVIGEAIAKTLAFLGSQDAKDAVAATEATRTQQEAAKRFADAVDRMAGIDFGSASGDEIRMRREARRN